ncbi:MAG TPA: hypothetical protein VKZ92_00355 [Pseudohongiella sp.]|nr:hypothetical protein [Pseudohongiella sp.]
MSAYPYKALAILMPVAAAGRNAAISASPSASSMKTQEITCKFAHQNSAEKE